MRPPSSGAGVDLLIQGGMAVSAGGRARVDIGIADGRIARLEVVSRPAMPER